MSKNNRASVTKENFAAKRVCFICFSTECNGKHHINICTFETSKSNATNLPSQEDFVEATANNFSSNKNTVLLQTAFATATNISGKLHSEILSLFDNGSQRTHIST